MALVALPAQIGGLVLQEILERCDPGQQTEGLKAALILLEFTASRSSVADPSATIEVGVPSPKPRNFWNLCRSTI